MQKSPEPHGLHLVGTSSSEISQCQNPIATGVNVNRQRSPPENNLQPAIMEEIMQELQLSELRLQLVMAYKSYAKTLEGENKRLQQKVLDLEKESAGCETTVVDNSRGMMVFAIGHTSPVSATACIDYPPVHGSIDYTPLTADR